MTYRDVRAPELEAFLNTDGLTIIDQRDARTREQGQLPGAQPVSDALVNRLMRRRREDPPVLVYCYRGNQSRDLCGFLAQFGLSRVHNLEGGWQAWEAWQRDQARPGEADHDWLRAHGFDPDNLNERADLGMSPLMFAALHGRHELVLKLLDAGTDPNHINDDGHHALWFACVNGEPGLVSSLIEHGADIDNRNVNGVTCAIYAASTGKLEILRRLVAAGADLGIRSDDGYNALDSASTLPVLRFLRPLLRETA